MNKSVTWFYAWFIAQLSAFIAIERGFGGYWTRMLFAAFTATLAVLTWRGVFWAQARIARAWERRQARRRAIEESTP